MSDKAHHPSLQEPASYFPDSSNLIRKLWGEIEIPLLILLGLAALVLGTVGFQDYFLRNNDPSSFGRNLYAAVELFELRGGNISNPLPWELEVARWLSPAVAMYAVVLGLAALFQAQFQMLQLHFISRHVIICGLGQKGFLLAKALKADGKQVVVIDRDANNSFIPICRDKGILVLPGDARDEFTLRKAGVERANHLLAICGEDGTNAEIAVKARRQVANRRKGQLNCIVHIQDPQLWILLRQHEFAAENSPAFRLDFLNIYAQGARTLLNDFPILKPSSQEGTAAPHLLIIGLGSLGEQLVIQSSRLWASHYKETGEKLHISVVDPQAEKIVESLCLEYSLIEKTCDFSVYPSAAGTPEFHKVEFFNQHETRPAISHVAICLEDAAVGLSTALYLLEKTRAEKLPVMVRMTEDAGLASLPGGIKGIGGRFNNLQVFGLLERTCKPGLLSEGSHESVARAIHAEYIRHELEKGNTTDTNPSMRDWDCLSEDLKEMNRDQADQIGIKLNSIGCDVIPWSDYGADQFSFSREEIELLARIEHQRWCQEKTNQGWKFGPLRDERKKENPSLIAWEDPGFSEVEKEKDRNTIVQIPKLLALAGFQIYRLSLQ